jgi:hypothetical protein
MNSTATTRQKGRGGSGVTAKPVRVGNASPPAKGRGKLARNAPRPVPEDRLEADESVDEIDIDGLSLPAPSDLACSIRRNIEQYWEQKALRDALKDTFEEA